MAVKKKSLYDLNSVYRGIDEVELRTNCVNAGISQQATDRLVQHYCYDRTAKEIASVEFVEVDTIKVSIKRSRRKLKK
jgi:DNA-directed RNA polymerase specialized sigma24 family protein